MKFTEWSMTEKLPKNIKQETQSSVASEKNVIEGNYFFEPIKLISFMRHNDEPCDLIKTHTIFSMRYITAHVHVFLDMYLCELDQWKT